jgi:large subunit ribosomal protein L24
MKTHVKKDDLVVVLAGNDRGKRGKVLAVLPSKGRVVVEGVRIVKKAMRKSQDRPQGGFQEKEGSIHISNVMLAEAFDKGSAKKD